MMYRELIFLINYMFSNLGAAILIVVVYIP